MAKYEFIFGGKPATLELPDDLGNEVIRPKCNYEPYTKYIQALLKHEKQVNEVLCKHFKQLPEEMVKELVALSINRNVTKYLYANLNN